MAGSQNEIRPESAPGLLVPLEAPRAKPSLARSETGAAFVSQLLAERAQLPPQRNRRRSSAEGAIGAYASGGAIAVRRLPPGYRKSIVA